MKVSEALKALLNVERGVQRADKASLTFMVLRVGDISLLEQVWKSADH